MLMRMAREPRPRRVGAKLCMLFICTHCNEEFAIEVSTKRMVKPCKCSRKIESPAIYLGSYEKDQI